MSRGKLFRNLTTCWALKYLLKILHALLGKSAKFDD